MDGGTVHSTQPALRLTPVAPLSTPPPATPPALASASIDFDSVYTRQLPRLQLPEAHKLVERIREKLVAGQTPVPIHFDRPRHSTDPHVLAYLSHEPDAAERNARATEQPAADLPF